MQEYLSKMTDYFNRLEAAKLKVEETMKIGLILKGLGEEYRPFILSLDASEKTVSLEFVTQKVINNSGASSSSNEKALMSKKKSQRHQFKEGKQKDISQIKCHNCKKTWFLCERMSR